MRGTDRQSGQLFSYLSPESLVPQEHPLRAIRLLVNAALERLSPAFAAIYADTGRPSIPPEKLLRALLGAVANDVEIGAAASPADEVIGSSRQVNALGNELLGERLPTIDLAHDDLA